MCTRLAIFVGLLLSLTLYSAQARGSIATIAVTGDDASGVLGAKFGTFHPGPMNDSGALVFSAQLQEGLGGIDAGNDDGIWLFDGNSISHLGREGSGGVPGAPGTNFSTFHDVVMDSSGDVAVRATLAEGVGGVDSTNKEGIWRFGDGIESLVLRTNSGGVPGVPGASFNFLPTTFSLGGDGLLIHTAKMQPGVGGVGSTNDSGLWKHESGTGVLVARESTTASPGIPGGQFRDFVQPSANDNHQFVFRGLVNPFGDIDNTNNLGIWRYSTSGGELIARRGVGNVPGVSGANFDLLEDPLINGSGDVVFSSTLSGGTTDPSNRIGIWRYAGATGALLARTGSLGVPDAPGANFLEFYVPLLNDAGAVLIKAQLANGSGGVTPTNDLGLWKLQGAENHWVARTGSGGVPDIPGASFADFPTFAFNEQGFTVVEATLQQGGGVSASNDSGLWILGHSGGGRMIAREGDSLAGRTIASLSFVGNSGGNDGRPSGLNALGQLAFEATFTNGDSGLFLYSFLAGDFDGDGDVDGADLNGWETAIGMSTDADADLDGDSDGEDFLAWQRQFGMGTLAAEGTSTPVPEPAAAILWLAGFATFARRRRKQD